MRSRHALTAALTLGVVTILTVAACGSSVQGSAQVNAAAAESATSAQTTSQRTGRTSVNATDLSELSSMLNELSTELSVPTDLSLPSDLTFPTELSGFYNDDCLAVVAGYAAIAGAILGGSSTVEGQDLQQYLDQFGGEVPAELAPDVQALKEIAEEAQGKDLLALGELFSSEKYTTADAHVQAWIEANCGG